MIEFLLEQAAYAHWYIFALLLVAGLNIPVSEDLLAIGAGVLAATIVPENTTLLYAGLFFGAYFGDIENYWLARLAGRRLLRFTLFQRMLPAERLEQARLFLEKYGAAAIFLGRFIPFGVRNALFTTAGLSRMAFWKFALFDFFACLASTSVLFALGRAFGANYPRLLEILNEGKVYILIFALVLGAIGYAWLRLRRRPAPDSEA
ncbi:MAG: DedA family protein [bacterium]|nr:DedA family protein [bacterium]